MRGLKEQHPVESFVAAFAATPHPLAADEEADLRAAHERWQPNRSFAWTRPHPLDGALNSVTVSLKAARTLAAIRGASGPAHRQG